MFQTFTVSPLQVADSAAIDFVQEIRFRAAGVICVMLGMIRISSTIRTGVVKLYPVSFDPVRQSRFVNRIMAEEVLRVGLRVLVLALATDDRHDFGMEGEGLKLWQVGTDIFVYICVAVIKTGGPDGFGVSLCSRA
jgi:hypothetical protein